MKILCFAGYYLPAYKAGGPVKTIFNMVEQLEDFDFSIVTRDRDLGDSLSFQNLELNKWTRINNADVIYLTDSKQSIIHFSNILRHSKFDVLYLNSYFDFNFSIKLLIALKLKIIPPCAVVLAPRGEFSKGALAIKPFKKNIYMMLSSLFGFYDGVTWQASSELEKNDIIDALSVSPESIFIAKDLPEKSIQTEFYINAIPSSQFKVVFLSRISPKKNLDYALNVLSSVKCDVIFDIYGPQEDEQYWNECQLLIHKLPSNVTANYCGLLRPEQVKTVFSNYDLFFFPTRGENYGHVIAESLSVGTPVLISDQTPWLNLSEDFLGWDFSLLKKDLFVQTIEYLAGLPSIDRISLRQKVKQNSISRIFNEQDFLNNKLLFDFALQKFKKYKA